jgi:hypothetical protein
MLQRKRLSDAVARALAHSPVVSLLGPRQAGKTTLARLLARSRDAAFFDLEDPADLARLENPRFALEDLRGLVVLDEVQRRPALFELLRVLVDRPANCARFLLLGSASPRLVRGISESLAGRARLLEMEGFDLSEVPTGGAKRLWLRGGFPRSFLAASDALSMAWRRDFIRTFLERDVPQLGIAVPAEALRRFWTMVAHYHGQVWNAAEFARSLGSSEPTARRYLDLLSGAYMVRQLQPWFENLAKRQVKSPKVYVRDSGLLHALLSLGAYEALSAHPKHGASWEGFALEQVLSLVAPDEAYFWATQAGAELDLLAFKNGRRFGFEFKCTDAPRATKSMRIALEDLRLEELFVVHPGRDSYPLERNIRAVGLDGLAALAGTLGAGRGRRKAA